jgi:hypothetical protein
MWTGTFPTTPADATRYVISALGTGPEFTVFGGSDEVVSGETNSLGAEILADRGSYAIRLSPDDPWLSGPGAWEDGDAGAKRIVRTVQDQSRGRS